MDHPLRLLWRNVLPVPHPAKRPPIAQSNRFEVHLCDQVAGGVTTDGAISALDPRPPINGPTIVESLPS